MKNKSNRKIEWRLYKEQWGFKHMYLLQYRIIPNNWFEKLFSSWNHVYKYIYQEFEIKYNYNPTDEYSWIPIMYETSSDIEYLQKELNKFKKYTTYGQFIDEYYGTENKKEQKMKEAYVKYWGTNNPNIIQ